MPGRQISGKLLDADTPRIDVQDHVHDEVIHAVNGVPHLDLPCSAAGPMVTGITAGHAKARRGQARWFARRPARPRSQGTAVSVEAMRWWAPGWPVVTISPTPMTGRTSAGSAPAW